MKVRQGIRFGLNALALMSIAAVWGASVTDDVILNASLIATSGQPQVGSGAFYGYRTPDEGPGNTAFDDAKALAQERHVPLVVIWSNHGCSYCNDFNTSLNVNGQALLAWLASRKAVFTFFKGEKKYTTNRPPACKAAYQFVTSTCKVKGNYPCVGFYCVKADGSVVTGAYTADDKTYAGLRESFETWASQNDIELDVATRPRFAVSGVGCDRYEADEGTEFVDVRIVRDAQCVEDDYTLNDQDVVWTEGALSATVRVAIADSAETDALPLVLKNSDGETVATNAIYFVEPENNPRNPLWLGERTGETLAPGEWTMDRDLALAQARATGGSTLTLIGGSLWCPDCVNADAYLVDTVAFRNWATESDVFCAAVDVPKFPYGGETCLLTETATEVSARYVNATVPPQEKRQSGVGYLSRKMIAETGNGGTNATAILARNMNLATNTVARGGLCRPECLDSANAETGEWKTGIPCFILQNAAGEIKGRLFQFSNVSPTNDVAAAAYVRRLEELRQLADDPTEELNRHWSTATNEACELELDSAVDSTISAIDTSDFWRLTERETWARVTFTARGGADATGEVNSRLNLWKATGGTAEKVASVEGNLATGITLADQAIGTDASADYFVQVEAIETSAAFALDRADDSVVNYTLTAAATYDAGTVAFTRTGDTVSEADAKKAGGALRVYVPLARQGGASGATNATVTVDETLTTAFDDRYEIVSDTVSWADGELGAKSCVVDVFDDENADGTQVVVLRFGEATYSLTITDNDKMSVGKLSIASAVPALAKKGVVIAEEGSLVTIGVSRISGASGDVGCSLKTTAGEFENGATLAWRSREAGEKTLALRLPLLDACKAAKAVVSFATLTGIKADSSTKTLTVQLVATNAPRFEVDEQALSFVRYCVASQEVAVVGLAEDATAKVAKLSGSVPSGITVKLVGSRLIVAGTPSKAGTFEAIYQVSQVLNRKTTAGLTVRLAFEVKDVGALDPTAPGANPSVAKSRTFGDLPVVEATARRLTGLLASLTIPPTGKCSAKYKCKAGTISLSAPGWSGYDAETGDLSARLVVSKKAYALNVCAHADGTVDIALVDPEYAEGELAAEVAESWSATSPATAWMGYYTAAIDTPDLDTLVGEPLAAGNPILTMKMQTATLAKKGTMSYAGVLPNGQSFSGSGTLVKDGLDTVILPVYYRSSKEFFTLAPQIKANAPVKAVGCSDEVLPWWTHTETVTNGSFEVGYLRIIGSWYDATLNLLDTLSETATGHEFAAEDALTPVPVNFTAKTLTLDAQAAKAASLRLSFTKSTGMISGSFKTQTSVGKSVTATYKGVALPDWGDGCPSCGDIPWAMGAFWFSDAIPYELNGKTKSLSVKRGDVIYVESN